jgi:hypothetical protein
MDPLIEQQPPIKSTQARKLPRRRPRLNVVFRQMFQKSRNPRLGSIQQRRRLALEMFRKLQQIAFVSLARKRTQPLLHPQVCQIFAN